MVVAGQLADQWVAKKDTHNGSKVVKGENSKSYHGRNYKKALIVHSKQQRENKEEQQET